MEFWWGKEKVVDEWIIPYLMSRVTHEHTEPCLHPCFDLTSNPTPAAVRMTPAILEPCITHEMPSAFLPVLQPPSVILTLLFQDTCLPWNMSYSKCFVKEKHCRTLTSQDTHHEISKSRNSTKLLSSCFIWQARNTLNVVTPGINIVVKTTMAHKQTNKQNQ